MADTEKIRIVVEAEDNATQVLNGVRSGIAGINSALRQYNGAMSAVNRTMINMVEEAGSAIYDFTSDSIDNFSELSEQHAKTLGTMANDYDKTLESQQKFIENGEKLRQQAIDLAKYGINGQGSLATSVEVSSMQTELIKAGVSADTMLNTNIVSDVLQFALANQLDTASAVEFAVSLGSQFGVPYEDWGEMLDKVSHTADMSVIDVADIVQSMKYAGGITSGLDRDMSEVLGMISVLGNFGLRGSQAGSGIQAFLTRLLTGDTTVITQAMAEVAPPKALEAFYDFSNYAKSSGSEITYDNILNETFTDTDITGQLRPMDEVIDALETTMSELNDEEQAWFAKKLFGLYQMKSAYALINGDDSSDMALNDVITEIESNSLGTNANKLEQLINSQSGQFDVTANLIEGIKTELGQMLEPTTLAVLHEVQEYLKDPGNYEINWGAIQSALDESCDAIEEAYGSAIADAVRNLGGLAIDFGQVAEELAPEFFSGMLGVLTSSGGLIGEDSITSNWGQMISDMESSLTNLPEDLQNLGQATIDVIDFFGKLAALNVATTIAQLVTSALQLALAVINAGTVIVNGGVGTGGTGTGGAKVGTGGTGTGGAKVGTGGVSGKTVIGSADDVAKYLDTTADDVIATFGKKSAYSLDDIAKGLGSSSDDVIKYFGSLDDVAKGAGALGKLSSGLKALGIIGTIIQVGASGFEAYNAFSNGDDKGGVEAITGGVGSVGGGIGGAALGSFFGPVGTIIGAIIGSLGGDKLGRWIGGEAYESSTPKIEPISEWEGLNTSAGASKAVNDKIPALTQKLDEVIQSMNSVTDYASEIPGFYALSNEGQQQAIENYLENQISIAPLFTMEAPQIQVDITIDNNGNIISQQQSILNPRFNASINNWYQRIASQHGATTK